MTTSEPALIRRKRKRLGQFFTGEPLARLLAALASAQEAEAMIDPMAGSGDMLVAAKSLGSPQSELTAIEIDPEVAATCCERLASISPIPSSVRVGNAFDPSTWLGFEDKTWDLVITNPPYVRYQLASCRTEGSFSIPSSEDVRRGLTAILSNRSALPPSDSNFLQALSKHHSGLADLAVPSWILCASLVGEGGRLAMVVPETWLSRDYALPIQYLLHRLFKIESVVEDGKAQWFTDALVRTMLIVARRVPNSGPGQLDNIRRHIHIQLCAKPSNGSVVGNMYPDSDQPEVEFASDVATLATSSSMPIKESILHAHRLSIHTQGSSRKICRPNHGSHAIKLVGQIELGMKTRWIRSEPNLAIGLKIRDPYIEPIFLKEVERCWFRVSKVKASNHGLGNSRSVLTNLIRNRSDQCTHSLPGRICHSHSIGRRFCVGAIRDRF